MPRSVLFSPSRFRPLSACLWTAVVVLACLLCNTANAQTFVISLDDLTAVYDELFPERTRTAVWDTVPAYDFDQLRVGNQHFRVPHFLPHDVQTHASLVENRAIDGYRVTFRYPRVYSFEFQDSAAGDFTVQKPRDLSIPGLEIEFVRFDRIVSDIHESSLRAEWRASTVASISSQIRRVRGGRQGININIPIPMPDQLESIFGPSEKTHINITGREEITFAGETRKVDPFIGTEGRESQSLIPDLEMKQVLDVRLSGTIGDKVNIQVDHSSEALSDDANRIRLNYTGYDDEVIQLIELGNTSLSLPGSQLVSFSTQSKGLFGVKVLAQLGATDITVIASKQEGETSNASFTPTTGLIGSKTTNRIPDTGFVRDTYFFFNRPPWFEGSLPDQAEQIDVYREVKPAEKLVDNELVTEPGRAFIDFDGTGSSINDAVAPLATGGVVTAVSQRGDWELLNLGDDYRFVISAADLVTPVGIELTRPIGKSDQRALAVAYVNETGGQVGGQSYNELLPQNQQLPVGQDTLVLKLIKNRSPSSTGPFEHLWHFMMRNIYRLGLTNIDPTTFRLEIEDNLVLRSNPSTPDSVNVPYIQIFGLDQTDQSGVGEPDRLVDLTRGVVDLRSGILTFPTLTPFAPDSVRVTEWTNDEFWFSDDTWGLVSNPDTTGPSQIPRYQRQYDLSTAMYLADPTNRQFDNFHQYDIVVEAVSTSRAFSLNAFNIIENSEVVTVDGQRLTRGRDYEINYETGDVELKGDVLGELNAASKIDIDYEFKPFGGGASSSLVGFNTLSRIGQNARLGTTWLYESKNVASDKPRVGEEPTRAVVGGVNGSLQHQSDFLTDVVNKLPLVDTDAPSTISLSGEIAMSLPDPNTKGKAFVDDFEGIEDSDQISMTRRTWNPGSLPLIDQGAGVYTAADSSSRLDFKWYNATTVNKRSLNPNLDDKEDSRIAALEIEVNTLPEVDDTTSWVGVMAGFGGGGLDLTQGQFIEFWVNDFKDTYAKRGGQIHIDFGSIDEDFFNPGRGVFNDEDKNRDGFVARFDDTGLDGRFNWVDTNDDDFKDYVTEGGTGKDDDVNGDDWSLGDKSDRSRVNGTEENQVYDTEDLDGSGQLDRFNSYFSMTVDLADTAVVDIREQFFGSADLSGERERDSWRLYRIKLSQAVEVSGTGAPPQIEEVRHIRIWFNDVNSVVHNEPDEWGRRRIQMAEFKIVGNRWEDDGVRNLRDQIVADTPAEFAIGVISNKSDPGVYDPPIRPNVENEVSDKEGSLFLRYDNLEDSTQVRIFKRFTGNGIDITQYREIGFWVHTNEWSPDLEYYFRIGSNENNYYEVAAPVTPKFFDAGGWMLATVKLEDLTSLKLAPSDSAVASAGDLKVSRDYTIKLVGAPSLFSVRRMYAGIRNVGSDGILYSGEVWINDIFLDDVRRDIDYAQRVNGSVNFGGGVLTLSAGWTRTGPDFRGLRARRGSGSLDQSFNVNAKTNLMHFVPLAGFSIPISGNYRKSTSRPKFVPNSDTEISTEAVRDSLETVRVNEGFSTALSKKNSKNPLLKYSIDKITTNFSYSRGRSRAPASTDTTTSMNGTLGYQINWTGDKNLKIYKGLGIRYWLNSFNIRTSAARQTTRRWRLIGDEFQRDPFVFNASLNNSGSMNYSPWRSLTSTFNMAINRDVRLPHEWLGVDVGTEIRRNHSLKIQYRPPPIFLLKELQPDLSVNSTYTEDSSPNVRRPGDPTGVRNVSAARGASLKTRFDVGGTFGKIFRKLGLEPRESVEKRAQDRERAIDRLPPAKADSMRALDAADTTRAAQAASDTTRSGVDALVAFRKLGSILTNIRRLNANVSQRENSNYARIPDRPSLSYQLGIDPNSGVSDGKVAYDEPDRLSNTLSLSADTGVQVTDDIDIATRYSRSVSGSEVGKNQTEATTTSFPDVQMSWKGLEKIGLFGVLFTQTQANMNYKKSTSESGRKGEKPDNTRETLTLSPSLLFTWKNETKSTLGVSYNKITTDTRGSKSENTTLSVNLDFRKSFRGGAGFKLPIPLFRKEVKWKSTLDTSLSIAYSRTGGQRFVAGTDFSQPIAGTTSLRVSPNVAYTFSQALSGRAFVDYSRSYNEARDQTTTTVRVGVTAVFTF